MSRILVWDVPTRLFHWLFAGGVLTAFLIALLSSEHGGLFPFHMLIGLVVGLLLVLRIIWGLIGTRYARLRSFAFGPSALYAYLRGTLSRTDQRYIGHNPGSSYAIFAMLALVLGTVASGLLMHTGSEIFEELHSVLAWATVVVAGLHVLGVIVHSIRHQENVTLSMINGTKEGEPDAGIPSARPLTGLAFLLLVGLWAGGLYWNYNPAAQTTRLPLLGVPVYLGEAEAAESHDHATNEGDDD